VVESATTAFQIIDFQFSKFSIRKEVSAMFMGEYSHSIDPKGRLIIPAKLREELGDNFVVTKGLDGCLFAYPQEEWQNIEKRFREVPLTTKDARKFSRFFFAGAAQMELDKQGRILLPATLRSFAGLEKDVVLVGVLDRVEIWDKSRWDENNAYDDQDMDEIAEHMADLGLSI
jgi:MraZ protein